MVNAEETAIYNLLIADANVTGKIASYIGSPAVFNGEAPQDFDTDANPFVVFNIVAVTPWNTHTTKGYEANVDIRCYGPKTGSAKAVNELIDAVEANVNWGKPIVIGRSLVNLDMIGIGLLPPEIHTVGRVITAQMRTQAA